MTQQPPTTIYGYVLRNIEGNYLCWRRPAQFNHDMRCAIIAESKAHARRYASQSGFNYCGEMCKPENEKELQLIKIEIIIKEPLTE